MKEKKQKLIDITTVKFLLVGVINTLVGTGTMFGLYNCLGCSYWVSSAGNYIVGSIVSYFLNKYFTSEKCKDCVEVCREHCRMLSGGIRTGKTGGSMALFRI